MTLYELTEEYKELLDMLMDPDVDPQVVADTLEGVEGDIEHKAEGYGAVMCELNAKRAQIKKEVERLDAWADVLSNNINRMNNALISAMDAVGKKKIETDHFRFSIVGNGGKRPMRLTGEVPEEYMWMKPEIDTAKIRRDLEDGKELSFAYLADRGRRLSVR